jgi:hypothetical protein
MYNDDHVRKGWWAFDTINPNCWRGAVAYAVGTAADFLAVQEARVARAEVEDLEQAARNSGWRTQIQPCNVTEKNGRSAGVAVACRNHIGARNSIKTDMPMELLGRVAINHIGAVCKGGVHLGSCYLHSNLGVMAAKNQALLHMLAAVLATLQGPWLIGGDWNCTPDELLQTGWLRLVGGVICAPKAATCGDRVLDFFVVSEKIHHAVKMVCNVGDSLCSPHSPTRIMVDSSARVTMVRQLLVPAGFGARLPFGPVAEPSGEEDGEGRSVEELGKDHVGMINRLEAELIAIEGLTGKEADKKRGRAGGGEVCVETCGR